MAALVIISILLTRNLQVEPENISKRQLALETVIGVIQDFFKDILGEKGKMYIPYLMSVVLPINILEIFIRPVSLCMRLFGNVLGSFVVMKLIEAVAPVLMPVPLTCYFDIFDGLIQAYVFVFLTALFIKEAIE